MSRKSSIEDMKSNPDKGLENSSKAIFQALNPHGKQKLELNEALEHLKIREKDAINPAGSRPIQKDVEKVISKLFRKKNGKAIKESDMEKLNQRFMEGHVPRLKKDSRSVVEKDDDDDDSDEEEDSHEKKMIHREGYLNMFIRHSINSVQRIEKYAKKAASKAGRSWMLTLLPTGQIHTLVSFLLFSYVMRSSFLSWFVPLTILFISFSVMVISSVRLVRGVKRFTEFKAWAEFLDSVSTTQSEAIDTGLAEENYVVKHMSPYLHFLVASAFCVMAYGTSDKTWVLNAELGILSTLFYGLIVYIYAFLRNKTSLIIVSCQVVGTFFEGFEPENGKAVWGYLVSLDIPFTGVAINISISSILHVLVVFKMIQMCFDGSRMDKSIKVHMAKVVFPHIVAIVWLNISHMFLCYSSLTSVFRATAECFGLLFAMPAFTLFLGFGALKILLSMDVLKILITIVLIVIPTLYFKVWEKREEYLRKAGKLLENKTVKFVIMSLGFAFLAYVVLSYRPSGLKVPKSHLSWSDYKKVCLDSDEASDVVACHEFKGYGVTWEGTVDKVSVVDIDNKVDNFLNLLPKSAAYWMSCIYGDDYPNSEKCANTKDLSPLEQSFCTISPITKRPCHLQRYNIYKFRITMSMPYEYNLNLDVGHDFNELVWNLRKGKKLRFTGILEARTTLSTKVLYTISDTDEIKFVEKRHAKIEKTINMMLDEALNSLYHFLLYPVISYEDVTIDEEM
ncbi:wolframin-like [Styela clava]